MLVSVVIPTHQIDKRLLFTLEALLNQETNHAIEIIVVADGRTAAPDYALKAKNIKWIVPPKANQGAAQCRNLGVENSLGELIVFVDSDMVLPLNTIQEHVQLHDKSTGKLAVIGKRKRINYQHWNCVNERNQIYDLPFIGDSREGALNLNANRDQWWYFFNTCHCSLNKKLLLRAGGFDNNFKGWGPEDVELGYRLHKDNCTFMTVNTSGFHLDGENEKIMSNGVRQQITQNQAKEAVENVNYFLNKHDYDPLLKNILNQWLLQNRTL